MSKQKMPEEDLVNRYLWDSSGEPDPEVQRLENRSRNSATKANRPRFLSQFGPAKKFLPLASCNCFGRAVWPPSRQSL